MPTLDELAKRYLAYEKSDKSEFQRKARILQSIWKEKKGYEIGEHKGKNRGNYLPMPWAKKTLNNYLSDTIKKVLLHELENNDSKKLYGKPRIYNNLLSSQPLCFNLFAELQQDLRLATKVFNKLAPDSIKEVTKIDFEYSPGKGDPKFTGDRSAFDVYVEFKTANDERGFIGIEVKYHENLQNAPARMRERYFEVAKEMSCFKGDCFEILQKNPLEQIWRDHLLVGSILNRDDFEDGFFAFLYPKDNLHCRDAVQDYKKCLSDDKTFREWFLEDVANAIKEKTDEGWIGDLIDRYLNFDKIDGVINA